LLYFIFVFNIPKKFFTLFDSSAPDFIQKGGGIRPIETLATYPHLCGKGANSCPIKLGSDRNSIAEFTLTNYP